jgi:hypothetical protein
MANQVLLVGALSVRMVTERTMQCEPADLLAIGQWAQLHAQEICDALGDLAR